MIRLDGDRRNDPEGAESLVLSLVEKEAERGVLWIPYMVTDQWASALCIALYRLRNNPVVELIIDCKGGCEYSFDPCRELWWRWKHRPTDGGEPAQTVSIAGTTSTPTATTSIVTGHAYSIGLSYSVCATRRLAYPDARFLLHGEHRRWGPKTRSETDGHECFLEDHLVANWLARFTKLGYAEWLAKVEANEQINFGVAEALEWGVIDEVAEGV